METSTTISTGPTVLQHKDPTPRGSLLFVWMLRKLRKAKKLDEKRRGGKKRIKPISRPDTDIMISNNSRMIFRIVMFLFFSLAVVLSGYAPKKGPKLPPGFCQHGDITDTTGECMCHWQHKVRLFLWIMDKPYCLA